MLSCDLHVLAASLFALCGVAGGPRWVPALSACGAAFVLYRALRKPAPGEARRAILGGLVAGVVVATGDWGFVEARFLFHLRRDLPYAPISIGVEACRAALFAAMLYLYLRLRASWPKFVRAPFAAVVGLCVGLVFEHLGTRAGLWDWNASLMPDRQIGAAWAFLPLAWGMTSFCLWYCLMGFRRGIPLAFHPIGIGIRFGAAFLGFTMISYGLLVRVYGKVVMG